MTLTDFCEATRNWFDVDRHFGHYKIENGTLNLDFLREGQFFRIVGSIFNDGVHHYGEAELVDEEFDGAVWSMAVPLSVIELLERMTKWETTNADVLNSPFQSESFGVYSRSYRNLTVWDNFASDLARWQKL